MNTYYKKTWREVFLRLFFHLLYIIIIAAQPYIIKNMIDCDFANGMQDVLFWIGIFAAAIFGNAIVQYISQRSSWKLEVKMYKLLREDLFSAIILKEPKKFRGKELGDYGSMLNNDVGACLEHVEYVMEIWESIMDVIVYAVYIFLLDWRIAIVIYVVAIATMFLPGVTGKKLSEKRVILQEKTGKYNTKVLDLFGGYSLVNRNTYQFVTKRHERALDEMEDARYDYGKFKTFTNVFNGVVMYQVHVAAFAIIAILLMKGNITVGVATATIAYIQDFMFPIRTIVDCSSYLKSVEGVKNQILGEIKEKVYRGVDAYKFQKNITLDHVHFKYDTFELRDFSCVFEKGKKYALVGPSGTGKSTILNLLTGNLVPQLGEIRVDGQPLSYDKCLNSMVYANQQAVIYMESFMENITMFGSFDVDKLAEKMIPVERWNYFKGVSDCTNLSGGEKQLVSLARVLSEGKEILVLDEPFSALDKELEFDVCEKLLGLKDKTVIMVTHNEDENFLRLFDEVITFGEK